VWSPVMNPFGIAGLPAYLVLAQLAFLAAVLASGSAGAEPKGQDAALQQVLRKAQGVVRQLTQEKAALEAEKAAWLGEKSALEEKLKALEAEIKKLAPLRGEVERYKSSLESLQSSKTSLESQLNEGRQKEQNLLHKHQETIAKAREIQADNQLLVEAVKERERWIEQCGQRNQELLAANRELLEKYKAKGFWEKLGDLEPLTGLSQVQTENAAEEYRYKLEHLKATPFKTELESSPQDGTAGSDANPVEGRR
jgi:chromosome segregation ATPase